VRWVPFVLTCCEYCKVRDRTLLVTVLTNVIESELFFRWNTNVIESELFFRWNEMMP